VLRDRDPGDLDVAALPLGPLRPALHVRDLRRHPVLRRDRRPFYSPPPPPSESAAPLPLLGLSGGPGAFRHNVPRPGRQHHPRAAPGNLDGLGHPAARASGLLLAAAAARGGAGGAGLKHALILALLLASSPASPPAAPLTGFSPGRGPVARDYG